MVGAPHVAKQKHLKRSRRQDAKVMRREHCFVSLYHVHSWPFHSEKHLYIYIQEHQKISGLRLTSYKASPLLPKLLSSGRNSYKIRPLDEEFCGILGYHWTQLSLLLHRHYSNIWRCDRNHVPSANPFPTWPIYTTPQSPSSSDHIGQQVAPPGGVTKWSRKSLWRQHRWKIQISTNDDLGDTKRIHHKGLGFFGMHRGMREVEKYFLEESRCTKAPSNPEIIKNSWQTSLIYVYKR